MRSTLVTDPTESNVTVRAPRAELQNPVYCSWRSSLLLMTDVYVPPVDQHAALNTAVQALKARGFDEASAAWAVKALYPPMAASPLMPRLSPVPGVVNDNRSVLIQSAPATITASQTWDAMIVVPANEAFPAFAVIGISPVDFGATTAAPGDPTNVFVASSYPTDSIPTVCRNNSFATQTNFTIWPTTRPMTTRNVAKSLTVHMTASALNNGGSMTVGKIPGNGVPSNAISWDNSSIGFPVAGVSVFWSASNYILPYDEEVLARSCPSVHTGPARDGFFAVNTIVPGEVDDVSGCDVRGKPILSVSGATAGAGLGFFDPAPDGATEGAPWPFVTYRPCFTTTNFSSNPYSFPWWSIPRNQSGALSAGLIGRSDTDTTVGFFRGLSPDATLQLTLHNALQYTVIPNSPLASMVKRPAMANLRLLEAYSQIAAAMPDALPARYNSLALVAPMILNAIRNALPVALRVVPKIAGAISAAAPVVRDIVDTFRERDGEKPSRPKPGTAAKTTKRARPQTAPQKRKLRGKR